MLNTFKVKRTKITSELEFRLVALVLVVSLLSVAGNKHAWLAISITMIPDPLKLFWQKYK